MVQPHPRPCMPNPSGVSVSPGELDFRRIISPPPSNHLPNITILPFNKQVSPVGYVLFLYFIISFLETFKPSVGRHQTTLNLEPLF